MSREMIIRALTTLAAKLEPGGGPVSIIVMGGAAIVLLYDARESTKDVDAFLAGGASPDVVRAAAREVACEL